MHVVWFKKDLRLSDHSPLFEACKAGQVLLLYVHEPDLINAPDFAPKHLQFINESLEDLKLQLAELSADLIIATGNMPDVLDLIHANQPIHRLWSHEETGNDLSYRRDRKVKRWCKKHRIPWTETPQHGVIRGLKNRDGWAQQWHAQMTAPIVPTPDSIATITVSEKLSQKLAELNQRHQPKIDAVSTIKTPQNLQRGGESLAWSVFASFLDHRGITYRNDISSPVTAWHSCSRLSPYLTFGCISIRQVFQNLETTRILRDRQNLPRIEKQGWRNSLRSFGSRLRWHCHFIQKLESQPEIEFVNFNRAYDGLRENDFNDAHFAAFCRGETGVPMIDAAIRALKTEGWINFRMRAMLVTFASFNLWLHWQPLALFFARLFLDYEPGIHYCQHQMQAGTTGINTPRVYSPVKQQLDQDPEGVFVRHYVPELRNIPIEYLHAPEKMPDLLSRAFNFVSGRDYPKPIVDVANSARIAKERYWQRRQHPETEKLAEQVHQRHGSRRRPVDGPGRLLQPWR